MEEEFHSSEVGEENTIYTALIHFKYISQYMKAAIYLVGLQLQYLKTIF